MATTLRGGRSGVRIPVGKADISLFLNVQTGYGAHPPTLPFSGYRVCLPGLKRPERKANHSLLSIGEKKTRGAMPLLPLYAFMAQTG